MTVTVTVTGAVAAPVTAPAVAEVFAALGDPVRQRLVETLASGGAASTTRLARPLEVTRQAVDKHLRVLVRAGLVAPERRGREVLWSVRRAELERSAAWLADVGAQWDQQLLAVKRAAELPPTDAAAPSRVHRGSG